MKSETPLLEPFEYRQDYNHPSEVFDLLRAGESGAFTLSKVRYPTPWDGFEVWTTEGMRRFSPRHPLHGFVLKQGDSVWMSDTPLEISTSLPFVNRAFGRVLEVGLGIGLTVSMLNKNPNVTDIIIVEKNKQVADLVYKHVSSPKTRSVISSIENFSGLPVQRFDCIHFDIWPTRNMAINEMRKAKRLVEPLLMPGGFTYVWLEELTKLLQKRKPSYPTGLGVFPPCLSCGKTLRNDYNGLCMDCADALGLSELAFKGRKKT